MRHPLAAPVALAFGVLSVVGGPGASAQTPPGTTSEFDHTPSEGPGGTEVSLSGVCRYGEVPATEAFVILQRNDTESFVTTVRLPISTDSTFNGSLTIVGDSPPDDYSLTMTCLVDDQAFGVQDSAFQVLPGPPQPDSIEFSASATRGRPGDVVTMAAVCRLTSDRPGSEIAGFFAPDSGTRNPARISVPIEEDGSGSLEFTVPRESSPGPHSFNVECRSGPQGWGQVVLPFEVLPSTTTPPVVPPAPPAVPIDATPTFTG